MNEIGVCENEQRKIGVKSLVELCLGADAAPLYTLMAIKRGTKYDGLSVVEFPEKAKISNISQVPKRGESTNKRWENETAL